MWQKSVFVICHCWAVAKTPDFHKMSSFFSSLNPTSSPGLLSPLLRGGARVFPYHQKSSQNLLYHQISERPPPTPGGDCRGWKSTLVSLFLGDISPMGGSNVEPFRGRRMSISKVLMCVRYVVGTGWEPAGAAVALGWRFWDGCWGMRLKTDGKRFFPCFFLENLKKSRFFGKSHVLSSTR